jgi:hypothetical protein
MNSEDRVLLALKVLRQADQEREAPAAVEDKLLAAFRADRSSSPWMMVATLAAAAIVAVLLVGLYRAPRENVTEKALRNAAPVVTLVEQAPLPAMQSKTAGSGRKRSVPDIAEQPREIVTDFFPLMDVAPPLGRGELLRVAVPASAMRSVGLPVREERLDEPVQADVLIGEEGMVRAIRFVSQRN